MKFGRAILRHVEGYVPGEQPKVPGVIKLNTNENPYPPSPKVFEALRALGEDALRKYPDPLAVELRALCAGRYGYPGPEWIAAGNGMDELLALAIRAFVDPGDAVVSVDPTYTLYETLARLHGARFQSVPLDDRFQLPEAMFQTRGRICFLPRPNAPSGVCSPREDVARLCREFDGLVVIDEAYADFADDNCLDFPKQFENAVVMRTFSKSFSLAGMRIGIAVARPEIVAEFIKIKDSYNINAFSQAAAAAALRDYDYMRANVEKIRATRARVTRELRALGFDVPDSQSNFVLARWNGAPTARELFQGLRARNIIIRYFTAPRLQNALRLSIGSDPEMDTLLAAIRELIGTR